MRWLKSTMLVCAASICITACTFAPSLEQTAPNITQEISPVPGHAALSEETVSAFQDEPEPAPSASSVEETDRHLVSELHSTSNRANRVSTRLELGCRLSIYLKHFYYAHAITLGFTRYISILG